MDSLNSCSVWRRSFRKGFPKHKHIFNILSIILQKGVSKVFEYWHYMLQHLLTSQVNGDLVMLQSEEGKALQKVAENEARPFLSSFEKYISDQ